jgi:hypothetical protein
MDLHENIHRLSLVYIEIYIDLHGFTWISIKIVLVLIRVNFSRFFVCDVRFVFFRFCTFVVRFNIERKIFNN